MNRTYRPDFHVKFFPSVAHKGEFVLEVKRDNMYSVTGLTKEEAIEVVRMMREKLGI